MFDKPLPIYSQVSQFGASTFNESSAWLWLYSPKTFDTQVIRPYVYQFNGNMVDKLSTMQDPRMALRNGGLFEDPAFNSAIRPEANGLMVDMQTMSAQWTFVLMIDMPTAPNALGIAGCGSKIRLMASGWCSDEPVLPWSMNNAQPVINQNCMLYTTHRSVLRIGDRIGMVGGIPNRIVSDDDDIVGAYMSSMTPQQDLFICTPGDAVSNVGDIVKDSLGNMVSRVTTEGAAAVATLNNEQAPIPTRLKSPRHHLQEITTHLQSAIDTAKSEEFATQSDLSQTGFLGAYDPVEQAVSDFRHGLHRSVGTIPVNIGIDVSQPFTLGYLDATFGGKLAVQVLNIARRSQYDVIPQTEISAKVQFSSMVASAISTLASSAGLADIRFGFRSFTSAMAADRNGLFQLHYDQNHPEIEPAHLLCPDPNPTVAANQLEAAINMFRINFCSDIVPILKSASGDFELHCRHDLGSETIVDLHFMDFSVSNEGSGYYETSNRLPVTHNPLLGSRDTFIHNGTELAVLGDRVVGRKLMFDSQPPGMHQASFGGPFGQQPMPAPSYGFGDEVVVARH